MNEVERLSSFERLMTEYLYLSARDELVVIYDESFHQNISYLVETVNKLQLRPTLINLPHAQQLHLVSELNTDYERSEVELPHGLMAAMSAASGILNVVLGTAETTAVRRAIVNQPRNPKCRLAHVPDMTDAIISLIQRTPLDTVVDACEIVARALGNAKKAQIETAARAGQTFTLTVDLNGWDNEPIISSGVIPEGSWGNVPGGETFCCPRLEGVNGKICINGSVPHFKLREEDEIVLTFSAGEMVAWEGGPDSVGVNFLNGEQRDASRRDDSNWNKFAELGIGLNPAISYLSGNALFDEKAAGTMHIAIGDNSGFGRDVVSRIHHDLVTRNPTILLDGNPLVSKGVLCSNRFSEIGSGTVSQRALPNARFYLRHSRIEIHGGILLRRLYSGHRVGYVRIASEETSRDLASICQEMRTYNSGQVDVADFIREYPMFGASPTPDLLAILYHYRIIDYET